MFLVLEGIDGSGTTTQAKLVAERLRARGEVVHVEHEPTESDIGKIIRETIREKKGDGEACYREAYDWRVMALLFSADRQLHSNLVIEPALRRGEHVICDRYHLSTLCYQLASAQVEPGFSHSHWLEDLANYAVQPDLTVILDVPLDVGLERIAERAQLEGKPRDIYERYDFLRVVQSLYERYPQHRRVRRISGLGAPAEVCSRIVHQVEEFFSHPGEEI